MILANDGDEYAEPAALVMEYEAVVLHNQIDIGEKFIAALTEKDILNSWKHVLLTQNGGIQLM